MSGQTIPHIPWSPTRHVQRHRAPYPPLTVPLDYQQRQLPPRNPYFIGKNIAAFDSGGIRAAAQAPYFVLISYAVHALLAALGYTGKVNILTMFDEFHGTSAGGLNVLMLGGIGATPEEVQALWPPLSHGVFAVPISIPPWLAGLFRLKRRSMFDFRRMSRVFKKGLWAVTRATSNTALRQIVAHVLRSHSAPADATLATLGRSWPEFPALNIYTADKNNICAGEQILMSTRGPNSHIMVTDALEACCAAPGHYGSVKLRLDDRPGTTTCIDAAFGCGSALSHVVIRSPDDVNVLLSLGTGAQKVMRTTDNPFKISKLFTTLVTIATDAERPAQEMARRFATTPKDEGKFVRWNPSYKIGQYQLLEWDKVPTIINDAHCELRSPSAWADLVRVSQRLILSRFMVDRVKLEFLVQRLIDNPPPMPDCIASSTEPFRRPFENI